MEANDIRWHWQQPGDSLNCFHTLRPFSSPCQAWFWSEYIPTFRPSDNPDLQSILLLRAQKQAGASVFTAYRKA
jgi:hypothetical protein